MLLITLLILIAFIPAVSAAKATTELRVVKYAADGTTVLAETTVDYQWMEGNLPVYGDGSTHYYHQGPVFEGDAWNPEEDTNILDKDMGAVKGTAIRDLCDLVGGMSEEDTVRIKASDGLTKSYPYEYIYEPDSRQGPMVVTWYRADQGCVPDYYDGMRLVMFADTSTNPWNYPVFGVWDMHECWDEEYWYFYEPDVPTTTGVSVKYISEIAIFSEEEPTGSIRVTSNPAGALIMIDGDGTGIVTNATIEDLETGSYQIGVLLEGYAEPDEKRVVVSHDEVAEVHFNLVTDAGSLDIGSSPSGARVILDGEDTGQVTPVLLEGITGGSHMISLELDGFEQVDDVVTVKAGETSDLYYILVTEEDSEQENGYAGKNLQVVKSETFSGTVGIFYSTQNPVELEDGETARLMVPVDVAAGSTTGYARLYIFVSDYTGRSDNWSERGIPALSVTFRNTQVKAQRTYSDYNSTPDTGPYAATLCYDVTKLLSGTDNYEVDVVFDGSSDESLKLMGAALFSARETASADLIAYWLAEGCDVIWADSLAGTSTDTSASATLFSGSISRDLIREAQLIVLATSPAWSSEREHRITFNNGEWYNVLPDEGKGIGCSTIDATSFLKSTGNEASLASLNEGTRGEYLENRLAVLTLRLSAGGSEPAVVVQDSPAYQTGTDTAGDTTLQYCYNLSILHEGGRGLHLKDPQGTIELHFLTDTGVSTADGDSVSLLCLKTAEIQPENAVLAMTISPEDASADQPFVLAATADGKAAGLQFSRYSAAGDSWEEVETWYDTDSGIASCSITGFGTYALIDGSARQHEENPIFAMIDGFIGFITSILFPAESTVSPLAGIGTVTEWADPVDMKLDIDQKSTDEKYTCSLTSNPSGALISIDGSYTGRVTPSTISVNPGKYLIGLELEGFKPITETVSVNGDEEIDFELFPLDSSYLSKMKFDGLSITDDEKTGGISVESVPSGSSVYIDGKLTSFITPKVITGLREGLHTIRVKSETITFPVDSLEVWVRPNFVEEVLFDLSPPIQTSWYTISSEFMSGRSFTINGNEPEYTIPDTIETGGINAYITVKDGERYISYQLPATNGEDTEISLEPYSGDTRVLMVNSTPQGGEIYIDGFSTGLCTPFSIAGLSTGQHLIEIKKSGYLPAEKAVLITEGSGTFAGTECFTLEAYPYGTLVIDSEPQGAKIYIHNRYTGEKTPHTFKYMSIGTYNVKVVGDEVTKERDDVSVEPWKVTNCLFDLMYWKE